jgi:hypothetical protein
VPGAVVQEERVRSRRAGKEDVRSSVIVHVSEAHATPLGQNAVPDNQRLAHGIAKRDARPPGMNQGEAASASPRDVQSPPAVPVALVPGRGGRVAAGRHDLGEHRDGMSCMPPQSRRPGGEEVTRKTGR